MIGPMTLTPSAAEFIRRKPEKRTRDGNAGIVDEAGELFAVQRVGGLRGPRASTAASSVTFEQHGVKLVPTQP